MVIRLWGTVMRYTWYMFCHQEHGPYIPVRHGGLHYLSPGVCNSSGFRMCGRKGTRIRIAATLSDSGDRVRCARIVGFMFGGGGRGSEGGGTHNCLLLLGTWGMGVGEASPEPVAQGPQTGNPVRMPIGAGRLSARSQKQPKQPPVADSYLHRTVADHIFGYWWQHDPLDCPGDWRVAWRRAASLDG